MAKIRKPPVPYKMYRHFVVITIVLTAGLAFFADGEKRETVTEHVAEKEERAEMQRISAEKARGPVLKRADAGSRQTFDYSENPFHEGFGRAMDRTSDRGNDSSINPDATSRQLAGGRQSLPGYKDEYIESLSDAEYTMLVRSLKASGMLDPRERKRKIDALARASRARSGAGDLVGIE